VGERKSFKKVRKNEELTQRKSGEAQSCTERRMIRERKL
jgi:hypothetical protein